MLEHKGYLASVEFDADANLLHGRVVNTRDVITFQGRSVDEIRQAFVDSVEDYLKCCATRNEEPERPFSGKLLLRMPPELHRSVTICAAEQGMSVNRWMVLQLESSVARSASRATTPCSPRAGPATGGPARRSPG
jgi:predicted HicB family RNase H-like nuclease